MKKSMITLLDGRVFHDLTVLNREENDMWSAAMWRVRCTCGIEKVVRGTSLVTDQVKSCGCKAKGRRMPKGKNGKFIALKAEVGEE